ncbi:hypothetical protein G4228_004437 [Cervus hanglu yarkandensis]|nr:hypothetical protein G4228_004437 [Cervus hanglu yarkandensis]
MVPFCETPRTMFISSPKGGLFQRQHVNDASAED